MQTELASSSFDRIAGVSDVASEIVYASQTMSRVCERAVHVASGDAKVHISGETGVGKDLIARLIHGASPRSRQPLVTVNCAAFTETLLESELFGHVRGSFTDAYRDKAGKLQLAHNGTVFLDEIGEMSLRMQAMLLRFLETGEIQSVGADTPPRFADVRVVSATNRDLDALVAAGGFRLDLLYRVRVVHIKVAPLRERPEDIPPLIEHFLARSGRQIRFTPAATEALQRYRWPGNVRELQNVVDQLAWSARSRTIDVEELPASLTVMPEVRVNPTRERRRQVADDLYAALVSRHYSFWGHVHTLFLQRDITRHDIREVVRRGLTTTCGNYRAMLRLFGIPDADYKRFLNFLAAHDCTVDYRQYRTGTPPPRAMRKSLPGLPAQPGAPPDERGAGL